VHRKTAGSPTIVKSFFIPLRDVSSGPRAAFSSRVIHARLKQSLGALGCVWRLFRSDIDPGVPVATRNIRRNTNGHSLPT